MTEWPCGWSAAFGRRRASTRRHLRSGSIEESLHLKGGGRLVSSTRTHKACPLPFVLHLQETVDGEHLSSKELLTLRPDQTMLMEV